MAIPSHPPEPTIEALEKHAKSYEGGVQRFLGTKDEVSTIAMAKQGMIQFLWNEWQSDAVTYNGIQKATKSADVYIEGWMAGDTSWEEVLDQYEELI